MGPTNPSLTTALDNLAVVLAAQFKFPEATPFYTRALALREKATAENLNNLALVLQGKGDTASAEKQFARALDLASKVPALPGDQSVGENELLTKVLQNYLDMLRALGRANDAVKIEARWKPLGKPTGQ
jgi:tetratricopeptide (TPR) repeat protein